MPRKRRRPSLDRVSEPARSDAAVLDGQQRTEPTKEQVALLVLRVTRAVGRAPSRQKHSTTRPTSRKRSLTMTRPGPTRKGVAAVAKCGASVCVPGEVRKDHKMEYAMKSLVVPPSDQCVLQCAERKPQQQKLMVQQCSVFTENELVADRRLEGISSSKHARVSARFGSPPPTRFRKPPLNSTRRSQRTNFRDHTRYMSTRSRSG
jgi:hypothetical protein